jgi:ribosomal protein L3 glutamine methyltransferase
VSQLGLATLRDYIRWAMSQFKQAHLFFEPGGDNLFEEARTLVLGSLHLPYELHDKYLDCNLHVDEHAVVQDILRKRIEQRIPAAYLLGEAWFVGLPFKVDSRVMIPRSPLAEFIPQRFAPWLMKSPLRILDLCTGSGCIGIACALEFPDAEVMLVDVSEQALQVADENIALHQLDQRVYSHRSDMFTELRAQRFDLIVCNPPYLQVEDWSQLPREFQYEPQESSHAGCDGLEFIQEVLQQASKHLTDKGLLVIEVGEHQSRLTALYPAIDFICLEPAGAQTAVLALTAQQCQTLHDTR